MKTEYSHIVFYQDGSIEKVLYNNLKSVKEINGTYIFSIYWGDWYLIGSESPIYIPEKDVPDYLNLKLSLLGY